MKYLHKFNSLEDFNAAYNGSDYHEPWVSLTKSEDLTKIKIVLNYSGDPELELRYVEKAPVENDGDTTEMYIWEVETNSMDYPIDPGDYVATGEIHESEGDPGFSIGGLDVIEDNNGTWIVTNEFWIYSCSIIDGPINKVDYNKHVPDVDLIAINNYSASGLEITYANANYFGNLTVMDSWNDGYAYRADGPISEGELKNIKLRIIDADNGSSTDYNLEYELDFYNDPTWSNFDFRVQYASFSGTYDPRVLVVYKNEY